MNFPFFDFCFQVLSFSMIPPYDIRCLSLIISFIWVLSSIEFSFRVLHAFVFIKVKLTVAFFFILFLEGWFSIIYVFFMWILIFNIELSMWILGVGFYWMEEVGRLFGKNHWRKIEDFYLDIVKQLLSHLVSIMDYLWYLISLLLWLIIDFDCGIKFCMEFSSWPALSSWRKGSELDLG